MRVIWISAHLPFPACSGGRLRELELLRRLRCQADVQVVAVSKTLDLDQSNLAAFQAIVPAELHAAEPDPLASCELVGRHRSPGATRAVAELLEDRSVDLVHAEGFHLVQHVPDGCDVPLVVCDQNVEFELWGQRHRHAARRSSAGRAALLEHERCRADEVAAWRRADACVAVTEEDAEVMRAHAPGCSVTVVPDGADHLRLADAASGPAGDHPPGIVFVGNFGYAPNVDAAAFLLDEVLPHIRAVLPSIPVTLVGNAPPRELVAAAERVPGVTVTGWVEDLTPYLAHAGVVLAPLRIGGGVKVKVLEALALGAALVTTPVGAQGLPRDLGAPLVVPPRAPDLAAAAVRVLRDPEERERLRTAARLASQRLPTWDQASNALLGVYEAALERRPVGA